MQRYRTIVAGAVIAGTVGFGALLGLGGVAGAQTTTAAAKCAKAPAAEAKIQTRLATIQQHLTTLDAKITQATDAHHDKVVAKLTAHEITVQHRADALNARLATIQSRCPANA